MLYKILRKIERSAAYYQGKGFESKNISYEAKNAINLFKTRFKSDPAIALDVGANLGLYTDALTSLNPDINVHIFEPSVKNSNILNSKYLKKSNIFVNRMCVSNYDGDSVLYAEASGSTLASLSKRRVDHFSIDFGYSEPVGVITLSSYMKDKGIDHVDILKLDIEGHELDALNGLGERIKNVSLFQFEFGGANLDTHTTFQDFFYFFQDNKFELYRLTPFGLERKNIYHELDEFYTTTNYYAVKR